VKTETAPGVVATTPPEPQALDACITDEDDSELHEMREHSPASLLKVARKNASVAWYPEGECYVNLAGDYDYLEEGYYVSQDYEFQGMSIRPTCKEMLDAYIQPLFLEKARLAGLQVPEYYVSNGYFEPPVVIDPINPFMIRSRVVMKKGRERSIAKSMTRNFTYAICCQEIPPGGRVQFFRAVMGWCGVPVYREMAAAIWNHFHIPLARVRVVLTEDGRVLASDVSHLTLESLRVREWACLQDRIEWPK